MSGKNIYVLGGSKNIGYFASIRLLAAGASVTFLLRNASCFENDATIQGHIKSGKVHIVGGDALVREDVRNGWKKAAEFGPVDFVLFTVGGKPSFHLTKVAIITPSNLVCQAMLNVFATYPTPEQQPNRPNLIMHSSVGLTKTSHASLPFLIKFLYGRLLTVPHADKLATERLISHTAGWNWDPSEVDEPAADNLAAGWKSTEGMPAEGSLKGHVLIVRLALLTDGKCQADVPEEERPKGKDGLAKAPYRVSEQELGGYTVSRKDAGHFAAEVVLKKWDEYRGKVVNVGY